MYIYYFLYKKLIYIFAPLFFKKWLYMSFRQYGGINYAARNNIVKNNYTNANNLSVMTKVGQPSSIINVESGLYGIAGDITFQQLGVPKYGIMFSDGSFQNAAVTSTDSYWVEFLPQTSPATIYYTGRVIVGADPYSTAGSIESDVKLAVNGGTAIHGNLYVGNGDTSSAGVIFVTDNTDINTSKATLRIVADRTTEANYIQSGINADIGSTADLYFTGISATGTEWMVIKSDGKVGIGTTEPAYTLDVSGNFRVNTDALINGLTVGTGGGNLLANTVFGVNALNKNTDGINNVALGYQALYSDVSGNYNTAVGFETLYSNTSSSNTALGLRALRNNTTGSENVAIGRRALFCSNSSNPDTTTGTGIGNQNVAVGNYSLYMNQSSSYNVAIGNYAMYSYNETANGVGNTAIGNGAMYSNVIGLYCTAVGYQASYYQTGGGNTSLGFKALWGSSGISTGGSNCAVGDSALTSNTAGNNNTSIGYHSLEKNTTGNGNIAIGNDSLHSNEFGSFNIAVGTTAMYKYTAYDTAYANTAIGHAAMYSNVSGIRCTAVGYQAQYYQTGAYNTSLGFRALRGSEGGAINDGTSNCAFGDYALDINTTGDNNVAVGHNSLLNNTSGNGNTAVGSNAGKNNTTTSNNTYIGYQADCSGNNLSNSTAIGYNSKITDNHQIVLGTNSENVKIPGTLRVTGTCTAASFDATSDYRIKENVLNLVSDSKFTVDNLRPIIYKNILSGKQDMGFIAHELQEHFPFLVSGEKDGAENQSVNYIGLIALLVKEIQELKQDIKILKTSL
jgi:hypothetical protein